VKRGTVRIAEIGVVAAAYAALVYAFPISHMPLQMRVAETLKPLVIWEPHLIPAFVLGNFLSNLMSPFAGPWDLGWMPLVNLVGAWTCWKLGRVNAYLGAAAYAVITAAALAIMFHFIFHAPLRAFWPLVPVELGLIALGVPAMYPVHLALQRLTGERRGAAAPR
jgi:uncharacterized membrane protein